MSRGLCAPLSPNEEKTLIRLAFGGRAESFEAHILNRLSALRLIEAGPDWHLTSTGRKRLARLAPELSTHTSAQAGSSGLDERR